jgi:hypothetical protein
MVRRAKPNIAEFVNDIKIIGYGIDSVQVFHFFQTTPSQYPHPPLSPIARNSPFPVQPADKKNIQLEVDPARISVEEPTVEIDVEGDKIHKKREAVGQERG